jgi:hypothetical protein
VLPRDLTDIFEEYTEDDYNLYVTKAENSGDNFLIDFSIDVQDINDKGTISQKWTIEAKGTRKTKVSFDFAPVIEIIDDHPLLGEFTDTQCQLYFTGHCKDPAKLFYELYVTHKEMFGRHHSFSLSFGEETNYFKPFQYTNGLLTEGPKKLMEKYADCLKQNGLDFTIIGERPAKYWDGEQNILENQDLKILFIGDTYIIAHNFSFNRHEKNSR